METKKPLMQMLLEAGYPRHQMFHHYSDLYVFATEKTRRIINKWLRQENLNGSLFVSTFTDQITGRLMYDIAFQYLEEE